MKIKFLICLQYFSSSKKYIPNLEVEYNPDFRQSIAESWPNSIDDFSARIDWGWNPKFTFEDSVENTLMEVVKLLEIEGNKDLREKLNKKIYKGTNKLRFA